jgi:hypothetical protein
VIKSRAKVKHPGKSPSQASKAFINSPKKI